MAVIERTVHWIGITTERCRANIMIELVIIDDVYSEYFLKSKNIIYRYFLYIISEIDYKYYQ